jgi:EpsD family peptidyl-prolyl cis-trans isomerase
MGLGLILSMTVLGACGGADDDPIVARVNLEAITEAEVDALLAERGLTPGSVADEQRASALEELITERLMAQGARSMGLAHDASTAPVANRLLARAYLEKQLGDLPQPSDEAVEAYFLAHPELFAKRRRYHLQEIAIEATGDDLAAIDERSRSINTLNELVGWLQQRGLPFRTGAAIRSADELPRDLLAHLKDAREGEVVGISTPSGRTVVQVVEVTPDPVSFTRAEGDIRKYLANRKVERLLEQIDAELRANAKIERFGLYRRH